MANSTRRRVQGRSKETATVVLGISNFHRIQRLIKVDKSKEHTDSRVGRPAGRAAVTQKRGRISLIVRRGEKGEPRTDEKERKREKEKQTGVKIDEKRGKKKKTELGGTFAGNSYCSVKSDDRRASSLGSRKSNPFEMSFWENYSPGNQNFVKKKHPASRVSTKVRSNLSSTHFPPRYVEICLLVIILNSIGHVKTTLFFIFNNNE